MAEVKAKIVINPPRQILFKSNTVSDDNVSKLTIQNLSSSQCIAFKIKTTAPKNYVVKPNQGIIDKQGQVEVEITFCPSEVSFYRLSDLSIDKQHRVKQIPDTGRNDRSQSRRGVPDQQVLRIRKERGHQRHQTDGGHRVPIDRGGTPSAW